MNYDQKLSEKVKKGFSSYIRSCLFHTSRDFFRNIDRDLSHTKSLDEETEGIHLMMNPLSSPTAYVEAIEDLLGALETLNPMEKKLLFLKFFEEKTDSEIAIMSGITQQAVNKNKRLILAKLKSHLQI